MNRIGLALSGGGFRASLYHLGLIRFLRDAEILPRVTHVTSVSGGSVLAAHLALNWDRYNGSPSEFDAAAAEVLSYVRMDVRNRIVRRFPLALPLRATRRLLGRSNRKLSRTGLLEYHYEKYLYGDKSLFQLPERPQFHLLATNLSEGCLCSFNRNGMIMVRRGVGGGLRLDRIRMGLATVAMAVTASSAFPGFFPPLELSRADVGAGSGEFERQTYTDGAVFDNLGVRMFRSLGRLMVADSELSRDDFYDIADLLQALSQAGASNADTPLRRLTHLLVADERRLKLPQPNGALAAGGGESSQGQLMLPNAPAAHADGSIEGEEWLLGRLTHVLRHFQLDRDPLFGALTPADSDAAAKLRACQLDHRALAEEDQVWLNRHLVDAAFRQATGRACFRRLNRGLDGVLVSDVGKAFEVQAAHHAGGLIRTAMRASDILIDRVWQLETETFGDTPGFVFAPVTEVIEPSQDPTALHPEVQRQVAGIRTDLDRFSELEISSLVRHGYCVGRKACRARPELFGEELPSGPPWDPTNRPDVASATFVTARTADPSKQPALATVEARSLQKSAARRIWSSLFDYRDWTSYVYVPIIVPILVLLPYLTVKYYQRSQRLNQLVNSLSQGRPELGEMSLLLDRGPQDRWTGVTAEEVRELPEPDLSGFDVVQDSWITDLRLWTPGEPQGSDSDSRVHHFRRLLVSKEPGAVGDSVFRWSLMARDPNAQFRFPPQRLEPKLRKSMDAEATLEGQRLCHWEASFDFHSVPAGENVDLLIEYQSAGLFLQHSTNSVTVPLNIRTDVAELTVWILMPLGKEYTDFRIIRSENATPQKSEAVVPATEYLASDFTVLAFKLLSVDSGYTYEIRWTYE